MAEPNPLYPDVAIDPFALVCGEATAADAEELHPDIEQSAQARVAMVTKTISDSMVGIAAGEKKRWKGERKYQ